MTTDKRNSLASGPGRAMGKAQSSLFDIPAKLDPVGSSHLSLGVAPSLDMDMEGHPRPKVVYENTYQMDPPQRFLPERVKPIILDLLSSHIGAMEYHPVECAVMAKTIAQEMKTKVKAMNFNRFKLVCLVTIGEKRSQDVRQGSRCLWDASRDNYASSCYENPNVFATGSVYAVYFE